MKKSSIRLKPIVAATLTVAATFLLYSCGGSDQPADKTDAPKAEKAEEGTETSLNIRYIDGDSISAHYQLAKEFQEQSVRAFSKLESVQQSKGAEIQKFASQIEQKMRNNGYLSEDSYNADMMKLNKMQQDAQTYLASLQRTTENDLAQQQIVLNDSIESFIKVYNKSKGYDAILFKAAGIYFNPALDITQEVIDGLNARYSKPKTDK